MNDVTISIYLICFVVLLGVIPPFMDIDIDVLDKIVDRVETDVIDRIRQVPIQKIFHR